MEQAAEERVEIKAIRFAENYFRVDGWEVTNVSRVRGSHGGYDLLLAKGEERLKVEVKGCSKLFQIPDLYSTEVDPQTMQLIADLLCVVYFVPGSQLPQLALIPREKLRKEFIVPKAGYRISGRFKNKKHIDPLLIDLGLTITDHTSGAKAPSLSS